ncbi:hypothetical protein [Anaerovorax sp. IOR16]|uniref:hypothetical protein n=1 Tax=Anaerovorax sp. IOR16 TaxID=2773458 RepID=UPI0019CF7584|nr:hypothetical protein [Anaerovorax sp. IOR16]
MNKQNKNEVKRGTIQIGISSLLLVFTVLCLVVFSVLALSSAKADWKLAQKNKINVKQYYEADSLAEEMAKKINEYIMDSVFSNSAIIKNQELLGKSLEENLDVSYNKDDNTVSYQIDISDEQLMIVCLKIKPYNEIQEGIKNYEVLSWVVQNKMDYEIDESIPVWNGEE